MKRILLFTENLGSGGAERQLTGLAVMLKQRGYAVKVITYVERQFHEQFLVDNGVDYELIPSILSKSTGLLHLFFAVRKYKPDTIISFLSSPNLRMCLLRKFYKTNLIVSERSHTLNWSFKVKLRYFLYRLSDCVVANSFSETENIASHCHRLQNKLVAIPNYVDVDKFTPAIEREHGGDLRVVAVGRLIPSKNVIKLLDAISIMAKNGVNIHLTWTGAQYDKLYLADVKDKVANCGLSNYVTLQDQTDNVVDVYRSADFFCLPTLYEGYPNVICEAMSCGLPVVCSNVCENPRIVEDGVNGFLFNPDDANDIANALTKMVLMTNEERQQMGLRNRKKIVEHNSMEAFVTKYIDLF